MTDERDTKKTSARVPLTAAEVEAMLNAYGANAKRWPKQGEVAEPTTALRQLECETKALDQVLSRGAVVASAERERALADRIVAAASRMPRVVPVLSTAPQVTPLLKPASTVMPPATVVAPSSIPRFARRADVGRSLALLAASLIIGVSIGQSGLGDRAFAGLEDLTGLSLASSDVAVVLSAADIVDED
jgi:hypothetical protein